MNNLLYQPLGCLGGTFDPIHLGHIQIATAALKECHLSEVRFILAKQPALRNQPSASIEQRQSMLKIALQNFPQLAMDDRELKRAGPSYTIDTLISLRKALPKTPICWIVGFDQLYQLTAWYRWKELLNYAHFIIAPRNIESTTPLSADVDYWLKSNEIMDYTPLHDSLQGKIYRLHQAPILISATEIRKSIAQGKQPKGLDPKVYEYIKQHALYSKKTVN